MAALLFKMAALGMKTVAKPLGDRFKTWVMSHPQYRQTVLSAAQVGSTSLLLLINMAILGKARMNWFL
jgi:hypothetical protein